VRAEPGIEAKRHASGLDPNQKRPGFSVFVYLYESEAGSVNPTTAEYIVVLTGARPP